MKRELHNTQSAERLLQLTADTLILVNYNGICEDIKSHSDLWFIQEHILLNKNIFRLLPKHTLLKVYRTFRNVCITKQKIERNFRLDLKDGTYYFKCIMQPYDDMILCQYRDITKRNNVKLKLERAINELNEIQKVAHIGQWKYNTSDNIAEFKGYTGIICEEDNQKISIEKYINQLIVEEDRFAFKEWVQNNTSSFNSQSIGYRIKYNGIIYYLRIQTYLREELSNGNYHLEGYIQNVTDIQRQRNDINILTHVVNNARESIYAAKKDGSMIFANQSFRQNHHIPDNIDLCELRIFDIVGDIDSLEKWKERYHQVKPGEFVDFISNHPIKHNKDNITFEGTLYHVTTDDGESTYWSFAHNISERLKFESHIKCLNSIMDTVMENLPAAIVVKDISNNFNYLYRNSESYNREIEGFITNAIGKNDFDFFSKEVANKKQEEDLRIATTGENLHHIEERKDKKGNILILDKRKMKVEGKDFSPIIISIEWDITEMELMRRELEIAKEKAEKSDKLKSAFLANMSHEIRTPLNAIIGFSRIIAECEEKEERDAYYEIIDANNERLLSLINEILDLSKIESGTMEFSFAQLQLYKLCQEVYYAHTFRLPEGVQLIFESSDKLLNIETDKNRLFQVLSNLIGNATKFTTQGSISYGYKQVDGVVYFHVKDTGTGISSNKLNTVFERFVKLNDNIQGTGLGLSICKSIIERLGGEISVSSEYGKGTEFTFWIPISIEDKSYNYNSSPLSDSNTFVDIKNAMIGNNTKMNLEIIKKESSLPQTILIAEDVDNNYKLLSLMLNKKYNLIRATNGMEAVTLYDEFKPDLILMDLNMPELNGIEATKIIRQLSSDINIIAQSAYTLEEHIQEAVEAGCNDFISKPITKEALDSIIDKYL